MWWLIKNLSWHQSYVSRSQFFLQMTHPSPDTLLCNLCDPFLIPVLWSLWLHLAPIPHYICYPFYTLYQLIHVTNLILMNSIYFSGPLALGSSYIYFSLRAKWWLQGGVGGRFPSGWNSEWARWSESSAFSMATRAGDVGPLGISRVGLAGKKFCL